MFTFLPVIALAVMAFIFPFALVTLRDRRVRAQPNRWFEWFADLRVLSGVGVVALSLTIADNPVVEPLVVQYALIVGAPAVAGWLFARGLSSSSSPSDDDRAEGD